jgi:hypothetical protein
MRDCKCGSKPLEPSKVKGLNDGYVVKCSYLKCPAKAQRQGKLASIEAWDTLTEEE